MIFEFRRAVIIGAVSAMCLLGGSAAAKDAGDIMVRLRGLAVLPDAGGAANDGTTRIGGDADADASVIPEVDISYFITRNFALELILATTRHSMSVNGSSLGDVDLGEVSLLPPTLTLQYHPFPGAQFSPYIGAGINYTVFFNADRGRGSSAVSITDIDYSNSFGYAFQIGMDVQIRDRWYLNADVKKLFLNTDVTVNNGVVKANDVDLDPWLLGVGFGYRF